METLQQIFPTVDPSSLQATLNLHNDQLEPTIDYLLTQTTLQEHQDHLLAQRLAAEDEQAYHQPPPNPNTSAVDPSSSMPSLADVAQSLRPIMTSLQHAGRVAADGVHSLYRDFVASPSHHHHHHPSRPAPDEAVVLTSNIATSSSSAHSPRQRRPAQRNPLHDDQAAKKDA